MAEKSNIIPKYLDNTPFGYLHMTVGSATVLAPWDLIDRSSGAAIESSGVTNDFVGLNEDLSRTGDTEKLKVYLRSIVTMTVSSAAYAIGADLAYSAGANGTDWVYAGASSGEDAVGWSWQYSGTTTTLLVLLDSYMVGNAVAGTGLWETSTDAS